MAVNQIALLEDKRDDAFAMLLAGTLLAERYDALLEKKQRDDEWLMQELDGLDL